MLNEILMHMQSNWLEWLFAALSFVLTGLYQDVRKRLKNVYRNKNQRCVYSHTGSNHILNISLASIFKFKQILYAVSIEHPYLL